MQSIGACTLGHSASFCKHVPFPFLPRRYFAIHAILQFENVFLPFGRRDVYLYSYVCRMLLLYDFSFSFGRHIWNRIGTVRELTLSIGLS